LVKLVIEEAESADLERHVAKGAPVLATSRIAVVEVARATRLANPAPEVESETERLLGACMLVDITEGLLAQASALASREVRTLDALHLASALRIGADELVAYDRRLAVAAAAHGLVAVSPGPDSPGAGAS
jgi:predicted nucleic acid-binding protein